MPYRLCLVPTIAATLSTGLTCLILTGAQATVEAKTAQECYRQDSRWTVACGALEGPQKLRDDCFRTGDRELERCLDAATTSKIEAAKPDVPATRTIKRAPTGGVGPAQ